MRLWAAALLLALSSGAGLAASAAVAQAVKESAVAAPDQFAVQFSLLRAQDDALQQIGWKLRTGNAPYCSGQGFGIGLMLQDAGAYPDILSIRRINQIEGDFFVQSVASGGPADQAGLKPAMEVAAIGDTRLASFALNPKEKWRRLEEINAFIDNELAQKGSVFVTLAHMPQPLEIRGVATCPGRFELITGYDTASANRERVAIGSEFVGLSYPEDELAAVLAHELAHILLNHPDWLDANGRGRRNIRSTEREADQLMPWLLANAGYDPAAAVRFMKRWGPKHSGGLFRKRTHDGWDERVDFIQQQLPVIKAGLQPDQAGAGKADWSSRFPVRARRD